MSDKIYQNFIYLFNNENFINVKQNKTFKNLSNKYELKLDYKSFLSQLDFSNTPNMANVYEPTKNNTFMDYPRKASSTLREKQEFVAKTILPGASLPGPPIPTVSNDPFRSPHKKVIFDIDNNNLSLAKYLPNQANGIDGQYGLRFPFVDKELPEGFFFQNVYTQDITENKYGTALSTLAPYLDFSDFLNSQLQETGQEFLYFQNVPIAFENFKSIAGNDDFNGFDTTINYFTTILNYLVLYGNTKLLAGNSLGFQGFSTQDISTMIGVPYDIHTSIEKNVHLQSHKHLLQPKYEKIYNYYDPQYEPLVGAILDQNIINERSLPSIYDFLYLDTDFNSIITFLGLPEIDPQDITLSNLNQYLDVFGNVYGNYLQLEEDGVTVSGFIGEDFFDEEKNFLQAGKSINPQDIQSINNQVIENSKIGWTDLTALLKQLPLLSEYTTDIKKKGTPLWMEELKTGVYFSEKSLKTFNQTLDKDSVFPFLVKINIPTEQKGTLGAIFSNNGILDSINTYAASVTIPTPNNSFPSTVGDFYGGVVNGDANENFNLFSEAKMTTFKMYFEDEPSVPSPENFDTLQAVLSSSSPVRKEFIEKFGVLLTNDFGQSDDQYLELYISLILSGGITFEMQEFLKAAEPALGAAGAIKEIVKLFQFIKKYKKEYGVDLFLDTLFYIGDESLKTVFVYKDEDQTEITSDLSSLLTQLKIINFKKSLKEVLIQKNLLRTPVDVQNGKFAHQETLMYEIAKYGFDEEGNEVYIQSIFLPITDDANLSYYDTQIIPRKKYYYKIFTHKIIVGTDYKFVPESEDDIIKQIGDTVYGSGGPIIGDTSFQTRFYQTKYEVKPYFQFVRVPYYNVNLVNTKNDQINYTLVDDKPPLPPLVNFVPYRGVNDKILVLMNNSIGEITQHPIIMFEEDKQLIQDAAIAQEKIYMLKQIQIGDELVDKFYGPALDYKSDDQEGVFQAYRIVNKPTSYIDFEKDISLKVFELNVEGNFKNDSFQDDIVPNVDYYYTFRFQDIHGKISNPTEVYKVRMEQGIGVAPYLKIEVIDILKGEQKLYDEKFVTSKPAQKYIMIKPSDGQNNVVYQKSLVGGELTYDGNGFPTDPGVGYETVKVEVGDQAKSVFGKKFKLRMTSKQTGKKIDVNFTVEQPKDVVNETGNIQYEKT